MSGKSEEGDAPGTRQVTSFSLPASSPGWQGQVARFCLLMHLNGWHLSRPAHLSNAPKPLYIASRGEDGTFQSLSGDWFP